MTDEQIAILEKQISKHVRGPAKFAEIKTMLEATVMIELIKLLRAENENRQENGRTSEPN